MAPGVNGSQFLEIVYGDTERQKGAVAHAHPEMEQGHVCPEGEATAEIDGVTHHVRAGDLLFFPAGVFHALRVNSDRIRLLVIYAPP